MIWILNRTSLPKGEPVLFAVALLPCIDANGLVLAGGCPELEYSPCVESIGELGTAKELPCRVGTMLAAIGLSLADDSRRPLLFAAGEFCARLSKKFEADSLVAVDLLRIRLGMKLSRLLLVGVELEYAAPLLAVGGAAKASVSSSRPRSLTEASSDAVVPDPTRLRFACRALGVRD